MGLGLILAGLGILGGVFVLGGGLYDPLGALAGMFFSLVLGALVLMGLSLVFVGFFFLG